MSSRSSTTATRPVASTTTTTTATTTTTSAPTTTTSPPPDGVMVSSFDFRHTSGILYLLAWRERRLINAVGKS